MFRNCFKTIKNLNIIVSILLFFVNSVIGQGFESSTYGVIVEGDSTKIARLLVNQRPQNPQQFTITKMKTSTPMYIVAGDNDEALYALMQANFDYVELNHKVEFRQRPNDPRFREQYHHNLIKSIDAWALTTGGKNGNGEDVVIGIIDDGFDLNHVDLVNNYFKNLAEIPNNGIDDDGNGYIDDYLGYSNSTKSDAHPQRSHGTNVAGVVGAKGNNGEGITGVNWDVKLLLVSTENTVSSIIEGYEYFLKLKKDFISSNGKKGANIVAVNQSSGISKQFGVSFPNWCRMYDLLGNVGVLSVVSTSNEMYDIDQFGDVPATCASDFLVVVNSSDDQDKFYESGYGVNHVDISAPGKNILTTDVLSRGTYRMQSGTSLSAPMVAGAIGLLHAFNCPNFQNINKADPGNAALSLKSILLASAEKKPSFSLRSVSEGRLDLNKALQIFKNEFCSNEFIILNTFSSDKRIALEYFAPFTGSVKVRVSDPVGKEVLIDQFDVLFEGKNNLIITCDNCLSNNLYFLSIINGKKVVSSPFYYY